ncbi:hypothetical protein [Burkholderia sp. S-53]|uniref:hypothetical protein n=1 Tax=Burkholderia sp. S-53 TaxID=2906514 RepID=UPI0021D0BC3D|nr:hypothetical protein [Burkholderia sp. S-53]UXU91897.1 hypothetical protein LXM88_27445 [Burkholderia sp. S-53]
MRLRVVEDDDLIGSDTQSPGSGLGLLIVTRIAQYFGGTVQFEVGIGGQGLGVVIALPSVNAAGSLPRSAPADEHDDRSRAMPRA